MERKIGETFEYEGKKLMVTAVKVGCDGCFFYRQCSKYRSEKAGECSEYDRSDHKNVIFMEVKGGTRRKQKKSKSEKLVRSLNLKAKH